MLPNGLYSVTKFGGGTYAVRDGVSYGVPTYADAVGVWGADWQRLAIAGHDDDLAALPIGPWSAYLAGGANRPSSSSALPLVVLAAVALALFA